MQDESLDKAKNYIISSLSDSDIEIKDKMELMINIRTFLEHYDEDLKLLRINQALHRPSNSDIKHK